MPRDNSPEWFTQTICSIERKMPYTNAIWGVLLEKNYWIYDLNFPFKQNENEKKSDEKYGIMFILLEMFDYDLEGSEVLERKMSEIKIILVYCCILNVSNIKKIPLFLGNSSIIMCIDRY